MTLDLLTAGGLTAAFSTLLALVFVLVPPARKWFVALDADTQQAVTGAAILLIAAGAVAAGCAGLISFVPCTVRGIGDYLIGVVLVAILGDRVSKGVFAAARYLGARAGSSGQEAIERAIGVRPTNAGKLLN